MNHTEMFKDDIMQAIAKLEVAISRMNKIASEHKNTLTPYKIRERLERIVDDIVFIGNHKELDVFIKIESRTGKD